MWPLWVGLANLADHSLFQTGTGGATITPPATASAYSGNMLSGQMFTVTKGGCWFKGWYLYVCASGGQPTTPQKFALWAAYSQGNTGALADTGSGTYSKLIASATSGTLTSGQWNFVPLATPIQLSLGGTYLALVGINGPFPIVTNYWKQGGTSPNGVTSGPLLAFSNGGAKYPNPVHSAPFTLPSSGSFATTINSPYSTASPDPTVQDAWTQPFQQDEYLFLDVLVGDTAPLGYTGTYRIWPNRHDAGPGVAVDIAEPWTMATEFKVTLPSTITKVWYFSPFGAASLATEAAVWDVSTGALFAGADWPGVSWVNALTGGAATAGCGWCYYDVSASHILLPLGDYKVSVYNANGGTGGWSAGRQAGYFGGDANTGTGQEGTFGEAPNGIIRGPILVPVPLGTPPASPANRFTSASSPYTDFVTLAAQGTFGWPTTTGLTYPSLYVTYSVPSGNTFFAESFWIDVELQPVTTSYVTGLKSTTGPSYFIDNYGNPKFLFYDNPWGIIANGGKFSASGGSTAIGDIDNLCTARAAQGFTGIYFGPFSNATYGTYAYGNTWDQVPPFVNGTTTTPGTPDSGLNNAFWSRVDRLISDCAIGGMTALINIAYIEGNQGDIAATNGALSHLTNAQLTAFGTALAARYAHTPNIIWVMGNDYNYAGATSGNPVDAQMKLIHDALVAGGDTHVWVYHPYPESDSRQDFGTGTAGEDPDFYLPSITQYSMIYTYIQTYYGMEYAYSETSPIPMIWGDGYFYQGAGANPDLAMRQMFWWAVTSGARGAIAGSDLIWPWSSGTCPVQVTVGLWYTTQAKIARTLIESLPGWYNLIPDTSSALITAGRGTRTGATSSGGGGSQYGQIFTDNYISASRVPDGSLALIYFSGGTAASTITIDQTKLKSPYTATWVDPTNGAKFVQAPGSTYSAGTARGNNAAGKADWVLVLQASTLNSGALVCFFP